MPKEEQGVLAKSVQVPGALLEIKNNSGKIWTIPAENDAGNYSLHKSPFDVRQFAGYNPDFTYEFHGPAVNNDFDDLPEMINDDWVPVDRKELGVPESPLTAAEYGQAQTSYHAVGKQVCIMKPKILVQRKQAEFARFAKTIAAQMAPVNDAAKGRLENQSQGIVTDNVSTHTTFKEPV